MKRPYGSGQIYEKWGAYYGRWRAPDGRGVTDVEVEHGPDEGEAAGLAGETADHLGAAFDLAERPLEQFRASPPAAVSGGVPQVHDQRGEVVGPGIGRPRRSRSRRRTARRSRGTRRPAHGWHRPSTSARCELPSPPSKSEVAATAKQRISIGPIARRLIRPGGDARPRGSGGKCSGRRVPGAGARTSVVGQPYRVATGSLGPLCRGCLGEYCGTGEGAPRGSRRA